MNWHSFITHFNYRPNQNHEYGTGMKICHWWQLIPVLGYKPPPRIPYHLHLGLKVMTSIRDILHHRITTPLLLTALKYATFRGGMILFENWLVPVRWPPAVPHKHQTWSCINSSLGIYIITPTTKNLWNPFHHIAWRLQHFKGYWCSDTFNEINLEVQVLSNISYEFHFYK